MPNIKEAGPAAADQRPKEGVGSGMSVERKTKKLLGRTSVLTVPNLLSLLRLCMIPWFVWLYCVQGDHQMTAAVLVLSGITDVADGYIARRFGMVSDLGKIIDPIADKLTQAAMLLCLFTEFPLTMAAFVLMAVKETFAAVTGVLLIRRTGQVLSADWHGKLTTCMLYAMMILHVLWYDIPTGISNCLVGGCIVMMGVSCILYGLRNLQALGLRKETDRA